ncbi:Threonine/homoserine/homoserine lactone efflux protein [Pseudoxanthobacter soli DSM 19599]|uniref:Threonine/homoserine/homoserine lactone efflux protein n=1 Tax=Pseudoxanthobacter soli DSM 19599 TaxID=1123029 RepID=A0A1M7ZE60_9HYPH|nr:LysE family translocator [Pseudoxanthobacter soli]SHO62966.1 Threonine/homoserine/homoserine lactone efflux protein [Pseudoxanthobacter soli DSM 19599]
MLEFFPVAWTSWVAFAGASAVLVLIPGPTVLLVVSYALGQGWRTALPMAIGVALGDFTAMTLSLAGLGAVLAASATVFTAVKWIGAAYLVWLGIKLWRAGGLADATPRTDRSGALRMLAHAWLVTALNPKGIIFFVAFLPQFLDRSAPFLPQMLVFGATFIVLAFANVIGYALLASRARRAIRRPGVLSLVNKVGGGLLIGAGVATVGLRASQG